VYDEGAHELAEPSRAGCPPRAGRRVVASARSRTARACLLLLALGLLLSLSSSAQATGRPSYQDRPGYQVVLGINSARARNGLPPLRPDSALTHAAYLHSRDMARRRYFTHDTLHGWSWNLRLKHYVQASVIGETLDLLYRPRGARKDARRVVRDWLRSPAHRAVLLAPSLHRIGVAHAAEASGRLAFFTADFAN
jgi:uncharacterized protein YkwD